MFKETQGNNAIGPSIIRINSVKEISSTNIATVNKKIYDLCKKRSILINVADNPKLCDFYMGAIVTKGNLKIGISTKGKSPTLAKRIRQFLEKLLPDEINPLLETLQQYRSSLKIDFQHKVIEIDRLTKCLIAEKVEKKT